MFTLIFRSLILFVVMMQLGACDSGDQEAPVDQAVMRFPVMVAEDQLSIPRNLTRVERYTDISISLKMNFALMSELKTDETLNFDVNQSSYWLIQHDQIQVVDSIGKKHQLKLYLVPQSKPNLEFAFGGFATLNDIAFNTATLNLSQTAYAVRGSMLPTVTGQHSESATSKVYHANQYHKPNNVASSVDGLLCSKPS